MANEASPLIVRKGSSTSEARCCSLKGTTRRIIIEPVFFLYTLAVVGDAPLQEQYIFSRFKDDLNVTVHQNSLFCDANHSDTTSIAMRTVQEQTSHFQMILNLVCSSLSLITTIVYGTYSDSAGRKIVLILSILARMMKFFLNTFVIRYKLSVLYFLPGEILVGLGGGFATMVMAVHSYISETTTIETRTFRFAILECCLAAAVAMSQLGLGYFVKNSGFLYPTITLLGVLIVNLFYVVTFVPELRPVRSYRLSPRRVFGAFWNVYSQTKGKRHIKLVFLNVIGLTFLMGCGGASVQILFVMNNPLCWGPEQIGVFRATSSLVSQIVGLVALKVFQRFHVSDYKVLVVGTVSAMAGNLLNAWATTTLMMYIVFVVAMLMVLPLPITRAIISRQVKTEEHGTVFAGVASIESLSALMVGVLYMFIYKNTLSFMPGFVFLVSALFAGVTITIILLYVYVIRLADDNEEVAPFHTEMLITTLQLTSSLERMA